MERVRGGQAVPVARLPVAGRHRVAEGLIPVGIRIGDGAPLLFRPGGGEQSPVQDREDVITLNRGDDVLGPAHYFGEAFLHLLAGQARVILQVGTGERGHDRDPRNAGRRRAEFLDEGERGSRQVPSMGRHRERLSEVLQQLIQQDQTRGVGLQ